jgi:hypothetical protein
MLAFTQGLLHVAQSRIRHRVKKKKIGRIQLHWIIRDIRGMMRSQRILRNICSAIIPSLRRNVIEHAPAASIATSLSQPVRYATSSSSKRWLERQKNDPANKLAELKKLRSRAGIKLEEINAKYEIFKSGQTVVDLVGLS